MAVKITEAAGAGLDHPAFDGVPRTTGKNPEDGDEAAMKLLMFMDGSSSLRDLAEVLTLEPAEIVRAVLSLHGAGVIAFDEAYTSEWLEEPRPEPVKGPAEEPRPEPVEGSADEKIRVIGQEPAGPIAPEVEPQQEVEEVAGEVIEEGRLDDTPAWQVLTRLARKDFSGRVRFTGPTGRREVLMMGGRPVFCSSDVEEEDLARLLRQRESIEEEDYQRYREAVGEVEPSRILVRLGVLPEYNRLRAIRWQAQTVLYGLLELDAGTFLVEKLEKLPRGVPRFDLSFPRILTKFLDEKLPVDDEVEKLQDKMELYVVPTSGAGAHAFQDKEQRLWEAIQERPRRLKDVLSISTLFKRDTYKFILLLLVNGLVELSKSVAFEEGPVDLRLIDDIADDLEDQNYFDVLGLHAVSDSADISAGYRRMMKKFDPSGFKSLDDTQRAALKRCAKRIEDAHAILKDESKRNEYRREVFTTYQLAQFAQLQYQKGEIYLWWRQSPAEAFPFFRSAMEMDTAQPLYWAAYAMGALSGGSSDPGVRRQSVKLADRVASMGNVDPVALVLAGGALIKAGQAGRGEECLQKAKKLSPGNAAIAKMIKTVLRGGDS